MKLLVTGGCGYKGSVLVPKLLKAGYSVRVLDKMWFGNLLEPHPNLEIDEADVINAGKLDLSDIEGIIHLASIANDPTGDLNPKLTWETSGLATMQLADAAARAGVKKFIYASSGSVYGIKEEEQVTEDLPLVPISEYNKTKMVAERCLLSYSDKMTVQILRPATVCGVSPRMRFDVSVNLLTLSALKKQKITVFGGDQIRPNVHIEDITSAYLFFLDNPCFTGVFNVGFENLSIMQIARMVQDKLEVPIEVTPSDDPRSYRVNSNKILETGFKPKFRVKDAINEIIDAYMNGTLKDEERWHNLNWMKKNSLHY
ncbi:nucleoside-diphosphate-sugar epimerase [SAR116 cluster alpha proteobacterium HIMB100]|nr:nucleoside-diphosphate-sugar epimerase [SAR116 cluster alpha proteobacterium HIMB100]